MHSFDLVIRGGEVIDGVGDVGVIGDVAISDNRIIQVGEVSGSGREEIDAQGLLVTPGFVDVHTHYDGQATWEQKMSPSSSHGVTSVVMGNCGVGFAPCKPNEHRLLMELMEGVEDVPEVVMAEGLPWNWETFPEYLDALDDRYLDIDVATQVPHSALRVFVMGERGARRENPNAGDLRQMRALTAEAIRAGALGVSTSRLLTHRTKVGRKAPSLFSEEEELLALAGGLADAGAGVFQIIPNVEEDAEREFELMRRIAEKSGRPLSFSLVQVAVGGKQNWPEYLRQLEVANAEGVEMRAQVFPRPVGFLFGLDLSFHPFSLHPSFRPLADSPLAEKVKAMRDPSLRRRLLSEKPEDTNKVSVHLVNSFVLASEMGEYPDYQPDSSCQIGILAEQQGMTPHEYVYDRLLENDGRTILFYPAANYADGNLSAAREMVNHPWTVLGLGDGGAHYGLICDASYPTFYLEKYVRDAKIGTKTKVGEAIRSLAYEPARAVGLNDRGRLVPGLRADVNVIDLDKVRLQAPRVAYDLPAGGRRLRQEAEGYVCTIKSGQVTYRDGEHTGALPGRLVRRAQPSPVP